MRLGDIKRRHSVWTRRTSDRTKFGVIIWIGIFLSIFAYSIYYYLSIRQQAPFTGRIQLINMSPKEEYQLGVQAYQQLLKNADVIETGPTVAAMNTIGARLAAVSDTEHLDWEFKLIRSNRANALALPGGKVLVYTGLLTITKNANGLAIALAHEMAHAIARHGAERISNKRMMNFGAMANGLAAGTMEKGTQRLLMRLFGSESHYGGIPFSYQHESEADYMGLILVARACFDPREAPKLLNRFSMAQRPLHIQPSTTHPNQPQRIEQLKRWIPQALKVREEYCQ